MTSMSSWKVMPSACPSSGRSGSSAYQTGAWSVNRVLGLAGGVDNDGAVVGDGLQRYEFRSGCW